MKQPEYNRDIGSDSRWLDYALDILSATFDHYNNSCAHKQIVFFCLK